MQPGTVVDGRFEVQRLAGSGGMARVYLATDRASGSQVALKVLLETALPDTDSKTTHLTERFLREADVLATLTHPAIVRHVAHGKATTGELYLAMEWLEGTTLAEKLKAGGLTANESVEMCRRVADGLGAAHARGVVHRDIKPSNLLLLDGEVDHVKILDFGVARVTTTGASSPTTKTGMMLGTPGYMAPEQARGHRGVDARADVFSLGCVLFECLAGRPPFFGENFMAVLAKILLEQVPRVSELRPEVPPALDALVARMLSKEAAARPADGRAVAMELEQLGDVGASKPDLFLEPPVPSLTGGEQRLLAVVLGGAVNEGTSTAQGTALMPTVEQQTGTMSALRGTIARFGGQLEKLLDGAMVVTFGARGSATDQVLQAARCALSMRRHLPDVPIALATGRGVVASRWPVGEVIDRAARLVRAARRAAVAKGVDVAPGVRIDETTAGLLDARFEIGGDRRGLTLFREREGEDAVRTLLGKVVPCVGRERELSTLEGMLDECVSEPVARAVLVSAAPGIGKSRVRSEFVKMVQARTDPRVEVWMARGDPMSAGSPFGMLAPLLRGAAGVQSGEPLDVRRRKLRARVARHVAPGEVPRVTEFLGELIGVFFEAGAGDRDTTPDSAPSVQLRSARQDPRLMGDQMRRAWEDFLAAECAEQPVLIVLEDLQWGDLPTVQFIDAALRHAHEMPFMVLALARPEVTDVFPRLWESRDLQPLPLRELKKSSCEKLVRDVLGPDLAPALAVQIIERAAGNAFYLEELMRAVAEGKGSALPETVLAMVQARLEGLEGEARRVLRAASVFGQVFWGGGVAGLLGTGDRTLGMVTEWLDELVRREIVTARRESRFPNQREYVFRHALVREAAYGMLTSEDRTLGHQLAGVWLLAAGETDAVVLAEHFERGGERERATEWWKAAAEQALEGNDLEGAIGRAERGVASGASGEVLGALRLVQAEAQLWHAKYAEAQAQALDAMALLRHETGPWFRAAGAVVETAHRLGQESRLAVVAEALMMSEPTEATHRDFAFACTRAAAAMVALFKKKELDDLIARLRRLEPEVEKNDPAASAWIKSARSWGAMISGDVAGCLAFDSASAPLFEAIGDLRHACEHRASVGYDLFTLGAYAEAEPALKDALAAADRLGLAGIVAMAKHNLGLVLAYRGELEQGRIAEEEAAAAYASQGDRRMEGYAHLYLALILSLAGDLPNAAAEVERATALLPESGPYRVHVLAARARVELLRGDAAAALATATDATRALGAEVGEGDSLARLVHAEALLASGDRAEAAKATESARAHLIARAAMISDPAWRKSFLERVVDHETTMALAADLSGQLQ